MTNIQMPVPTAWQREHSAKCKKRIVEVIDSAQSAIGFDDYMQVCLFAKDTGYYEKADELFGAGGDFTTSPERSHYFALAFANYFQQLKKSNPAIQIVEVGAGSGKFADDLVTHLKYIGCVPEQYIIIEKSEQLKRKQQSRLERHASLCEFVWQHSVSQPLACAMVIANEVLDVLPVKLLRIKGGMIAERCVGLDKKQELEFVERKADARLQNTVCNRVPKTLIQQNDIDYFAEVSLEYDSFIEDISAFVKQGIFFYIDYGYPRAEYYHHQRTMGTLICHFRHVANEQPLLWPGLQDISCSVDFTALAEAADKAKLKVDCYSTQANFLLASGILSQLDNSTHIVTMNDHAELKRLLLPGEMGERFQVMILSKNMDLSACHFTNRNLLHRL